MDLSSSKGKARKNSLEVQPRKKQRLANGDNCCDSDNEESMECNGFSHTEDELLGANRQIRKVELIRLLEQSLQNLGFADIAKRLEKESHIQCQSENVNKLRESILEGRWDQAVSLLQHLKLESQEKFRQAKFLILEQKFLEVGSSLTNSLPNNLDDVGNIWQGAPCV